MGCAKDDQFWRDKVTTAAGLLEHYGKLSAKFDTTGPREAVDAYDDHKPLKLARMAPGRDHHHFGQEVNLPPSVKHEMLARRDVWAKRIDEAIAKGLRGPAIGRSLGLDIGGAMASLVADAHGRPPTNAVSKLLLDAARLTKEAREAQELLEQQARQKAAEQAKQMPAPPPATTTPEPEPSEADLLRAWAEMDGPEEGR